MRPVGLVCTRLADMTKMHPEQTEGVCSKCGQAVGIYPTGQRALAQYRNLKITCSVCDPPWTMQEVRAAGSFDEVRQEMNDSKPVGHS